MKNKKAKQGLHPQHKWVTQTRRALIAPHKNLSTVLFR